MSATYTMDVSEALLGQDMQLPDCQRIVGFQSTRRPGVVRVIVLDSDAPPELDGKHVLPSYQQSAVDGTKLIVEVVGREVVKLDEPEICAECHGSGVCRLCEGKGHFE